MCDGPVVKVWRRAKYSILETTSHAMILHYRMTGQVIRQREDTRFVRLSWTSGDHQIAFVDPRRFGTVDVIPLEHLSTWLDGKNLGAEIWPVAHTGSWWKSRFERIQSNIKTALLRQDRVVGIGNILASEFCFAAGIHPEQRMHTLSDAQWAQLAEAAQHRVTAILEEERADKIGFLHEGAKNPDAFQVYGREGQACPRCSSSILKMVQSGRSTFYCATCQVLSDI
jgi:formamidopyrimidine-DNA glycosylase